MPLYIFLHRKTPKAAQKALKPQYKFSIQAEERATEDFILTMCFIKTYKMTCRSQISKGIIQDTGKISLLITNTPIMQDWREAY